ncbi:MAG: hypothetical protein FIA99_20185, partial [Ruminiclostridium sp.]|nr:hypothetical protein [Ruminiclostridium sp.]
MITKKSVKKAAMLVLAMVFISSSLILSPITTPMSSVYAQSIINVAGYTSADIQTAINNAQPGDIIQLPACNVSNPNYIFTGVTQEGSAQNYDLRYIAVIVDKAVTIRGEQGTLVNLGVPEAGTDPNVNVPPTWSTTYKASCVAATSGSIPADLVEFFDVRANGVKFENIKLTGSTTYSTGMNIGIHSNQYDDVTITGSELSDFYEAIWFEGSYGNLVKGNYIHHNLFNEEGYGVCITGVSGQQTSSGGQAMVRENEFMANRHDIASNGHFTSYYAYKNYTHDDDDPKHQPSFESHSTGGSTMRIVIRDNIFYRTRPMAFKSGSVEISGNYFDYASGINWLQNPPGYGYGVLTQLDPPLMYNPDETYYYSDGDLHDIYFGENTNDSTADSLFVGDYYDDGRFPATNCFYDGQLFEHKYPDPNHPPKGTSNKPLLGNIYVTDVTYGTKVDSISANTWYDLNVKAVDPQGAGDLLGGQARVGVQLLSPNLYSYAPGNAGAPFNADGNYFIETDGTNVYLRKTEGSTAFSTASTSGPDSYVDASAGKFQYTTDGSDRKYFKIRFKLLSSAVGAEWKFHGYVRDAEGNLPHSQAYDTQEGWFVNVNKYALNFSHLDSRDTSAPQGYHYMQALINNDVVWERDVAADAANTWFNESVDVTPYVSGQANVDVKFRLYDKAGVSSYDVSTYYDDVSLTGFPISNGDFETTGSWTYSESNTNFTGAYSTTYADSGIQSYKISFPTGTASSAGYYGCITQTATAPTPTPPPTPTPTPTVYRLGFSHLDSKDTSALSNYHFMQALINNNVVWQRDVAADAANTWYNESVDVTSYVSGQANVDVKFRLYENTGASSYPVDIYYDDVSLNGFTVSNGGFDTTGSWTYGETNANFDGAYSTEYINTGTQSYKISFPTGATSSAGDNSFITQTCSA